MNQDLFDFDLLDAFDSINRHDDPKEIRFLQYMNSLSNFQFKQLFRLKKNTFLRFSASLNLPEKNKGHAHSADLDILMLLAYFSNQSFT